MTVPMAFRWTGDSLEPLTRFRKECDQEFVIGEVYRMTHLEERSSNSHRHYFSCINEAWQNLPENLSGQYPTPEHLRKRALIKAGYYDQQTLVCGSKAEAIRVAAFMRPIDEFAVILVKDATVTRYTAKSQSARAMPKGEFQKSKDDVLNVLAELVGVPTKTLAKNAEAAA